MFILCEILDIVLDKWNIKEVDDFLPSRSHWSFLPAEGSLSKLIKSMCLTDHFSKTEIEWEKTQLTLSVI